MSGAEDEAEGLASVPVQCAALPDRDGGVWAVASLGADVTGVWTRGAPDRTAVCEAVREGEQDGPCGCRGDLRGGAASVDAVCWGSECGTAGPAGGAPDPQSGGHTAYGLGQSTPWLAGGVRGGDCPGPLQVRQALPGILEDGENGLSPLFRASLGELYEALVPMDERIAELDQKIGQMAQADEQARRLMTIPGIGVMTATALLAAAGDIRAFRNRPRVCGLAGAGAAPAFHRRARPDAGHQQAR